MARKRKGGLDKHGEKPVQRNAANARERARMRVLSKAFSRLKTTLPWVPADTKLSKLDTLRLAASYIAHLRQILTEDCGGPPNSSIHPINLTWPFTFNAARAQQEADASAILHHQVGASSVTSAMDNSFDVSSPSEMDYSHHVTQ